MEMRLEEVEDFSSIEIDNVDLNFTQNNQFADSGITGWETYDWIIV